MRSPVPVSNGEDTPVPVFSASLTEDSADRQSKCVGTRRDSVVRRHLVANISVLVEWLNVKSVATTGFRDAEREISAERLIRPADIQHRGIDMHKPRCRRERESYRLPTESQ